MSSVKYWGEIDDKCDDQCAYLPKVNFSHLIELSLGPECSGGGGSWSGRQQGALVGLPLSSVTLQAALLAQQARTGVPPGAPITSEPLQHEPVLPLRYIEKEYCPWSRGSGSAWLGRASASDCRRALAACAALELATHPPAVAVTRSVLETMADAAGLFITHITTTMRTIADKEASQRSSGFPDLISKTFAELGIIGIHEWYNERVLGAKQRAQSHCKAAEMCPPPEEVPELHFPASLEALGEGSLGPGYRMLHSLENADLLPRLPLHLDLGLDQPSPSQPAEST